MPRGGNIQEVAHLPKPELESYRKLKSVVQEVKNGHEKQ